jgi:glycosyltransferase involved in cell wall biosynthesis
MKIAVFYCLAFGGAKRVVCEQVKGLKNKGHSVDIYSVNSENDVFDPSSFSDNIYNYLFTVNSTFPLLNRLISDYKNFFILKNLHKRIAMDIDNRNYDLVLVHPDKYTQSPFLLRFLKTSSVYYCQEPLRIVYEYSMRLRKKVNMFKKIYEETSRFYRKRIDRDNVRSATHTIASCCYVRERMIESYEVFPKVIYCGVDEDVFHPVKTILKKNQVFYVGSPNVIEDGYDLVKKALEYIPKNIRPRLNIVSWKKANGERLTEEELVNIYNQSLITLCTSRLETFGLVPLESMASATPVIATKVSGHRETVIDGKTGFLVDFDPKEIAEKIMLFVKKPNLSEQMGKSGRKWVEENWTWDLQTKKLEELFYTFLHKEKTQNVKHV